ncbi:MAG: ATP-dependent sacrificial sulfur transferase LarE [Desulfofustis sp.]|nr:ATP-dependent sacrificial sulfur transferase LarE [Desulfofustis sp.]
MDHPVAGKYQHLLDILKGLPDLAVAYSGGVDSTLLCQAACTARGPEHVLILLAESCLLSRQGIVDAEAVINSFFPPSVRFFRVVMDPLSNPAFVVNDPRRCYICKSRIYDRLLAEIRKQRVATLADGTNLDDLTKNRPGLQAVRERGVHMPLVEAGFTKADIRAAALHFRLPNARLPSNSCLATRIASGTEINRDRLKEIEALEGYLNSAGFPGCRVRPQQNTVLLEVAEAHWSRLSDPFLRRKIVAYFQAKGFATVVVDLVGR